MSHRDSCPDRWEAEREGERAKEWGRSRSSNPHESIWGRDEGCSEAADAWRSGYRRAEMREEEQREEAQRRAEMRRADLQAEEDYAYQMQYEHEQYQQEQFPEEPPTDDAVDPVGEKVTE